MFLREIIFMQILPDFYVNMKGEFISFGYYKKRSYLKIFEGFRRFRKFFIYIAILLIFSIIT